ncbi:MAG: serine hydrolase [Anaerolineales bacterium]
MGKREEVRAAWDEMVPFFNKMAHSLGTKGYSLAIVDSDGPVASVSEGTVKRGTDTSPDSETIFMIGSCSKTITALAVMLLADRGKIDLDNPISHYLPINLAPFGKDVKVRHLLNHTSGLPNLGMSEVLIRKNLCGVVPDQYHGKDPFYPPSNFFGYVTEAENEIVDIPGERFTYSNSGYSLLAEIVAARSGSSFEDFVQAEIFSPLGMTRSGYRPAWFKKQQNTAFGHDKNEGPVPFYFEPIIAGCGGVLSCVEDMGRYLCMMLGKGSFAGQAILSSASVAEMETPGPPHSMGRSAIGEGFGPEWYGLGWMVYNDFLGSEAFAHGGSTGITSAGLFYSRDVGIGIAGACNHGRGEGIFGLFSFMLAAQIMGASPFKVFPFFAREEALGKLVGLYTGYAGIVQVNISYKDGLLWYEAADENLNSPTGRIPLIPAGDGSATEFRMYNGPGAWTTVEFFRNSQGEQVIRRERNLLVRRGRGEQKGW